MSAIPRHNLPALPAAVRFFARWLARKAMWVAFPTLAIASWFGNDFDGRARQATAAEVAWKTGAEFRKALDQPIGLKWAENPIRDALRNLSNNQQVAIWLDRRVDPSAKLQFELEDSSLALTLDQLCAKYKLGRSVVGPVIYIGPPATTDKLATLAAVKRQQVGALPNDQRARWLRTAKWDVPQLAEPRELVRELVRESGAMLQNPDIVPHDLWPAIPLPALTLADRLTLVLAGFDLTYQLSADGSTVNIVSIPNALTYENSYSWGKGKAQTLFGQLKKKFPELAISVVDDKVQVTGRYEEHELIERMLNGETVRTTKVVQGEKAYSLRVDNQPAGAVVKTVSKELGKEMVYDPALVEKLKTNVSFQVKDGKLEDLLDKCLKPLDLTYEITDTAVIIKAAK